MKNKKIISSLTALVGTGVLLAAVTVAFLGTTFGWFSENKTVQAQGMSIRSDDGFDTEQYYQKEDGTVLGDDATNIFTGLRPGDKVKLQVVVKNNEQVPLTLKLVLEAASEAEADNYYEENGKYHYFGTQLRLSSMKISGEDHLNENETNFYLLKLDDSQYTNGLQPTSLDAKLDLSTQSNRDISDVIEMAAGEEIVIDLEFEFVDNNENQNAYINFGAAGTEKEALSYSQVILCEYDLVPEG